MSDEVRATPPRRRLCKRRATRAESERSIAGYRKPLYDVRISGKVTTSSTSCRKTNPRFSRTRFMPTLKANAQRFLAWLICSGLNSCRGSATARPSCTARFRRPPTKAKGSISLCSAGELAIKTEDAILALSPPDSFTCRASSAGVAAPQSLAVVSEPAADADTPWSSVQLLFGSSRETGC